MLESLNLNGAWKIHGFDGQHGWPGTYCAESCDETLFIDAQVPGDVHMDLERAGTIADCNVGVNARAARWVEEEVWVYRKTFDAPAEASQQTAWLVFEGLDLDAVIYLNGEEIGRHANFFTPCRINVTGKVRQGTNTIAVRIDSGLYASAEKPGLAYVPNLNDQLTKRHWLRKPQYCFSWDWNPRLITVGIWRGVRLEWATAPRIDQVTVYPDLANDHSSATVNVRVFVDNPSSEPAPITVRALIAQTDAVAELKVEAPPGVSRQDLALTIANPKLWWPRPHGDQPLYTVACEIEAAGKVVDQATRRTGIRSIRLNKDKHPETGDYFIVEINGRSVFCKGGNWVPADMMGARVDAERYHKLVELAADANFNMLRIWGGGLYADHAFLDACDEMGVMVWHDFIFACAHYPGDDWDFLNNVRAEMRHITRDLSPHPSLVVWCGNNEIDWLYTETEYPTMKHAPDYAMFHRQIPKILSEEDPSRPYWPSSPYSEDFGKCNDYTTGDQHPWYVSLFEGQADFWKYRDMNCRFPNEGGFLGAALPATMRQFLPEDQRKLRSAGWEFHENACNYRIPPVVYQAVTQWLGWNPDEMALEDYLFYSGLLQAEALQEYIQNFRRRMFDSASAIFWMYNDSWPASHSWTIVDYYLRKRLSYHPVRRANAPVHIVTAVEGNKIVFFGVNDTPEQWDGKVEYGSFSLDASSGLMNTCDVALSPNSATLIDEMPLWELEKLGVTSAGAYGVLKDLRGYVRAQSKLFLAPFKDLEFAPPDITIERDFRTAVFSSPTFVWGVCLDTDGDANPPDNVFDLLPGIKYAIPWPEDKPLPTVQRCGSPLR